jgi:nitrate/nitrite-specific signal transduction histidine kinase
VASKTDLTESYVQRINEDTRRALAELRSQNERLRLQAAAFESDRSRLQHDRLRLQDQLITAREELSSRQDEHNALLRRLTDVELENERVAAQFLDIETQNTNLANLYVASHQLRSSLKRADVMSAIKEIIVNLIGSENFAIFERIEGQDKIVLADFFTEPARPVAEIGFGDGIIGMVAMTGDIYIASDENARLAGLTACIPLKVDGTVVGVIAVFTLLPQKSNSIDALDRELFELLASHAGVALYCSRLYENAARCTCTAAS